MDRGLTLTVAGQEALFELFGVLALSVVPSLPAAANNFPGTPTS